MGQAVTALAREIGPTVSVLMSCFNAARWLGEAIDSVFAQSYADFEFIIVDDGSTDETAAFCIPMRNATRVSWLSENPTPVSPIPSTSACPARAQLGGAHDADDICEPDRLERQMALCAGTLRWYSWNGANVDRRNGLP